MSKQVYISADYDSTNGDQAVVNELNKWGSDNLHKVDRRYQSYLNMWSVFISTTGTGYTEFD